MRVLYGHDRTVAHFVASLMPIERPAFAGFAGGLGIINQEGALVGGVVFSDWRRDFGTVELSAAAIDPRWLATPNIVRELGVYPFGTLRCYRMWARTAEENRRARRLLKGLGFKEEAVEAHHYGMSRHAIQARVLKPEWVAKWETPHGRRQRTQHTDLSRRFGAERLRHDQPGLTDAALRVDDQQHNGAAKPDHTLRVADLPADWH
jgi:hypothetical protein